MPLWMTLSFLTVVGGVAFGLNSYALSRLALTFGEPSINTLPLTLGLTTLSLSYFVIGKWLTPRVWWVRALAWLSCIWLGALIYLDLFGALAHLFTALPATWWPSWWWVALAFLTSFYGLITALRGPITRDGDGADQGAAQRA